MNLNVCSNKIKAKFESFYKLTENCINIQKKKLELLYHSHLIEQFMKKTEKKDAF